LPLLTAAEREQLLVEWNETARLSPGEATLPELFEEQAAVRPAAAALSYEAEQLSYGELNERANQVAHYLRRQGVERKWWWHTDGSVAGTGQRRAGGAESRGSLTCRWIPSYPPKRLPT